MNKKNIDTRIIYIIGTGRSGSTILDIILGNSKKIQSTGELYQTFRALVENMKCSCSKRAQDCPYWRKIIKLFKEEVHQMTPAELRYVEEYFERNISSFFRVIFRSSKRDLYEKILKGLPTTIAKVTNKKIVVDSSKNPLRGYMLLNSIKENVYFIHIIRDGRATMYSWIKRRRFSLNPTVRGKKIKIKGIKRYLWMSPYMYPFVWFSIIYFLHL